MRDIRFRAIDVDTKKWVYGSYFVHEKVNLFFFDTELEDEKAKELIKNNTQYLIVQEKFADFNMNNGIQVVDVIPETVGQYTGLKDKNGVEIYEGDIVRRDYEWCKDELGVITWNSDNASFQIKGHIPSSSMKHLDRMIKVGNIYENKELIE